MKTLLTLPLLLALGCQETPAAAPILLDKAVTLDKNAVFDKLVKSTLQMDMLGEDCSEIYSWSPTQSLAAIVEAQRSRAETWEATCQSGVGGHFACVVTLTNQKNEDEEFMAEYRFELDEGRSVIPSSFVCVFAG